MRKLNGLDKYVIFSFTMIIIFTIVELILSVITGIENSALITAWFSVWGGEVLSLALIKIFKLKDEDKECDWREKMGNDVSVADLGGDSTDL